MMIKTGSFVKPKRRKFILSQDEMAGTNDAFVKEAGHRPWKENFK